MPKKDPKERIIRVFKKTRRAFLLEYTCAGFVIFLLALAKMKGTALPNIVYYPAFGLVGFAVLSAEWSRIITRYKVKENKIEIVKGIIKQNKKNVYFHPLGFVPDLNVEQSRIQRLLGYGTVYVKGNNENSFEVRDVSRPHKVLSMIEKLIDKNRHVSSMSTAEKRN
ncbi:TPA: PH domain-containing protein [Candidatus Woesearchaeota archaeon]|nr:PH domain-containing protein [Candidatus Woesearchaeota archaeon]